MGDESEILRGTVSQVLFTNPDTGWTVIRLQTGQPPTSTTVVGPLIASATGHQVEVTGRWVDNPRYGRQFRAEHAVPITPETEGGIRAYLGSGIVDGIGAAIADRLVDAFGEQTLDVIQSAPERLMEVEGIGAVRAERIREALSKHLGLQSTMVFLYGLGLTSGLAAKIIHRYGERTVTVVQNDPYRLAMDVRGVGFSTADQIAVRLGVDRNSPQRAQAGLLHMLAEAAQDGHVYLPQAILHKNATELLGTSGPVPEAIDALSDAGRLVTPQTDPQPIYARPMFDAETEVVERLSELLGASPPLVDDIAGAIERFEAAAKLQLAPAQRDAIALAARARVMVITGGPGTGKTTLVRGLIALFEQAKLSIQLAAPTGRAAKRMTEATGLSALTLHRLLAYDPQQQIFVHNQETPLKTGAVIIDEMSMVDLPLMAAVTAALPQRVRLVMVGDIDQLPSVGPGQILRDLIESGQIPVARLDQIFRQHGGSGITKNAHRINRGELPQFDLAEDGPRDFFMIDRDDPIAAQRTLVNVVADRIPASFSVDPFESIQVLTPMHKGELGSTALNERLQARLNPDGKELIRGAQKFRVGDKVMQTKNNYELNVFNGDIGRLVYIGDQKIKIAFDDREVSYDSGQQTDLVLAYAMSIHKSQGSEYPAVVVPITTQHYVMLHRNLLYTAVTRGKRLVVLIGQKKALRMAVERTRDLGRHSRLAARLADIMDSSRETID